MGYPPQRRVTPEPQITWSYSAIDSLLKGCSLRWYFERILAQEPDKHSATAALGTAVHDAHAFARARQRAGQEVVLADLVEVFDASWATACEDPRLSYPKGKGQEDLAEQGRKLVTLMAESLGDAEVISIEQEFAVPITLPNGEQRVLTGFFDVVLQDADGTITVVDLKTAGSAYSEVQVDQSLQATVYLHAARSLHGEDVQMAFAVLVKTAQPKLQEVYAYRDEADFRRLAALIQVAETMIEAGSFFPQESWLCGGCGYRDACSRWGTRLPRARASA